MKTLPIFLAQSELMRKKPLVWKLCSSHTSCICNKSEHTTKPVLGLSNSEMRSLQGAWIPACIDVTLTCLRRMQKHKSGQYVLQQCIFEAFSLTNMSSKIQKSRSLLCAIAHGYSFGFWYWNDVGVHECIRGSCKFLKHSLYILHQVHGPRCLGREGRCPQRHCQGMLSFCPRIFDILHRFAHKSVIRRIHTRHSISSRGFLPASPHAGPCHVISSIEKQSCTIWWKQFPIDAWQYFHHG